MGVTYNGRIADCYACGGSGIDESSWDGRCSACHGRGEVDVGDEDEEEVEVGDE